MEFHVYEIGLKTKFRRITVREGVVFEGPAGWAEFSPFNDYGHEESAHWWKSAIDSANNTWPEAQRDSIEVNATVPAVSAAQAFEIVQGSGGCRTVKVKVGEPGQGIQDDIDRVVAVRDALGESGQIRIDVNGGWNVEEAIDAITKLDRAAGGLEYVEQPVATIADLARVRKAVNVLIAADESIRRVEDPYEVVRADAADIAVLKVQPLGGVWAALQIAQDIGLPVVVSSALESSIGLSAGIALAAALPELQFACGLATANLLVGDLVTQPLLPTDGKIQVGRVIPDPTKLQEFAAEKETTKRWLNRISEVQKVGN